MIILGGFTRLTGSGLSITEWNVFTGILPPLNHADWQILFAKYQLIPEFKIVNFDMNVEDFKRIFWLEYLHRILGRIIGLVTIFGFIFFIRDKNISVSMKKKIAFITFFIPVQGLIGWYMVKSGLKDNVDVSHFMLAFHLTMAFILLFLLARFYHDAKFPNTKLVTKNYSKFVKFIIVIAFIQVVFGAFVAGLKAGLIYNEFPMMGDGFLPLEIYDHRFFSFAYINNPAIVQFIHRITAYLLSILIIILGVKFYKEFDLKIKKQYKLVIYTLLLQIIVGITVLLTSLNIYLAVIHQLIAAILIYILSWFYISILRTKA
ncbi:MAG: COX15/CtaA family protein [Rickettsiales bacterium]|nr:COX15/CtaA family protein [Rickettsiales bacterium]